MAICSDLLFVMFLTVGWEDVIIEITGCCLKKYVGDWI